MKNFFQKHLIYFPLLALAILIASFSFVELGRTAVSGVTCTRTNGTTYSGDMIGGGCFADDAMTCPASTTFICYDAFSYSCAAPQQGGCAGGTIRDTYYAGYKRGGTSPSPAPSPEPPAKPEPEPLPPPTIIPPPPPPSEEPPLQCSADKGLCRKRKVQECLTVCPASWEFTPPAGYTGTTSRLLGEGYTTGVNAEGKYLEGESAEPEVIVETRIETQVVKETIVIEKEIMVEVTPVEVPQTVDGGSCQTFQTNTDNAVQELFTALDSFEKAGTAVAKADSQLRQGLKQNLQAASKDLKKIKKLNTSKFKCDTAHLNKIADAIQEVEKNRLVGARHDLAIMKKDEKVQPRFFGIRKDIGDTEALLKRISKEKTKGIEVEIQYFDGCKEDFEEIVFGEGLVLDSEISDVSEKCSIAKQQIQALAQKKPAKSSVLKKDAKKKTTLKKSLKKKSLKGKKGKKSSKKKKKSKKSKKKN